ncbi:ABC transporter ATP-binding protein [Candidatus Roizmanbacteria bacterium RIFCSPHIGHO2_12_FULL_33_9]|uniref:ABC transporter ATP-binding protein n=1 Tax=Candidatus Roizmanbacteria bacterium RIFCSPHIGHO2_12_FULL_33_9 TaxID=1802045 RepID=A0A1F7HI06_9BACT|nr:MAG: ABC transporter ATP-binding protein [Candidatus Roizmanbacteria bacterium RIFCSPHIGHO2_12_FULL_33_9]
MIKLKNVYKDYKIDRELTFQALKNINLTIRQGEFTSIMGPSGSGKSTLMHIIGLLDKPTKGEIIIEGKDISTLSDDKLSSLRNEFVGFVFQQFNLINRYTVLENVMLPTMYAKKELKFDPKERAMELLKSVGIDEKKDSYPNKISGGQQQRVAIARALIMNPKLILADEPTGNVDTKTGKEILKILTQLNKDKKITIVLVTHEKEIGQQTRRVINIIDGSIV